MRSRLPAHRINARKAASSARPAAKTVLRHLRRCTLHHSRRPTSSRDAGGSPTGSSRCGGPVPGPTPRSSSRRHDTRAAGSGSLQAPTDPAGRVVRRCRPSDTDRDAFGWPRAALRPRPRAGGDRVDAGAALRNSLELARHAERLGYHRHWVAEHHNMPGIASSSPAVLIAHLASATTTIRVGSGGVMLPNHAPLVDRRAVRDARGAPPGPHRPRHRPRARHRPDHRVRAAPLAGPRPPTTARRSSPSCSPSSTGTFPRHHGRPGRRAASPRSGCSARATSAHGSRASSGCRSRSPTTSCRRTRSPALEVYRRQLPAVGDARRAVRDGRRRRRLRRDRRAGALAARLRARSRSCGCAPAARARLPSPEEAAGVRVLAGRAASFVDSWTASHIVGRPRPSATA